MEVKQGILLLIVAIYVQDGDNHGMMLEPPGRSSRWRTNNSAPINYDDNSLFCGGYAVQWEVNGGKCGICGDAYNDPRPRKNELGGLYGQGDVVGKYNSGSIIAVTIRLSANHKGYFTFSLCDLKQFAEEEECFHPIRFSDGSDRAYVQPGLGNVTYSLSLPNGLRTEHGILRWQYRAGNNWGTEPNGTQCVGCGSQETYRNCADISIA
ncbi:hypothetical protein RI129_003369 [Pyrocoelia pectoralis]|uniref:Chitin-binding type-4 domain-containing protein n=1 Tax=Pyrocoelia pectoralis TaxID=417401 RepID=A0AAN7VHX9_9COLE